jgi:hypothetical protein
VGDRSNGIHGDTNRSREPPEPISTAKLSGGFANPPPASISRPVTVTGRENLAMT